MGGTRKFGGQRLHSKTARSESDGTKILAFDPARRTTSKQTPLFPKRPIQPTHPASPTSMIRGAIWNVIAFLFGTPGRRRSESRGTEPSGKRRA